METAVLIILSITVCILVVALVIVLLKNKNNNIDNSVDLISKKLSDNTLNSVKYMSDIISQNQINMAENQKNQLQQMERRIQTFSMENEQKLENIRNTVEKKLAYMQEDNNKQLEKVRETVDEKLQTTLENKLNKSFENVSKQLQEVYKGLGEMQNLAVGVGDLKKVLSNVKTRGILGEIQLSAILKEILSPEQYEENVATKKGSRNFVEFAVKLPSDDSGFIYLPIDSKFPGDTYEKLVNAMDSGNKEEIEICSKNLERTIKQEAKDIHDKYISPPQTTEFAVMFLPFEGLYAEVVNRGMVETLQREYKVNIAGPSTMAALLNSLQLGFKTLAVQKRSAEVWEILNEVKNEFDNFADVLEKTQTKLDQANSELDRLVGVRTRKLQNKLSKVQRLEN